MIPELPIVKPFTLIGYRFTDIRTPTRKGMQLKMDAGSAFMEFVDNIPPRDILCQATSTSIRDREIARDRAWKQSGNQFVPDTPFPDIQPALLAAEIEKFARINERRHTVAVFHGDFLPLSFAMERDGKFVGSWQWYAIREVVVPPSNRETDRRVGERLKVRAGWFPALTGVGYGRRFSNLSVDILEGFVKRDRMMELEDGRFLDIVQATATTVESGSREDTDIVRFARERMETIEARGGMSLNSRDDTTAPGRKRFRITDSGVAPVDEPEIEELERELRG